MQHNTLFVYVRACVSVCVCVYVCICQCVYVYVCVRAGTRTYVCIASIHLDPEYSKIHSKYSTIIDKLRKYI